ncbi:MULTISPECIES: hypothetical protein [unclassified Pseudomonas]|uniref:hypothetical protein n=1 Tax=unclassified Pseudomonas TaxID=196821 RepID=UPI00160481FE|nr:MULTISPECIES: hypothetical protein [unclassified Pseudomonas]
MMLRPIAVLLSAAALMVSLHGCDNKKGVGVCPAAEQSFFSASLKQHYLDQNLPVAAESFRLVGTATYDDHNNWWMVPFDLNGQKLQALLSCDGRLEITGR